ncbi:MAG: hypothetical protein EXS18_04835 [Verrucomicrobiae bacterium]|nr:hypothetical protein [Verrucomicrobiae bacterium]
MKSFLSLLCGIVALPSFAADPDFDSYWHDGKAELDCYKFTISRYGQECKGQGVLVYVTEPFSESKRVKADDPNKNPSGTFDAFKVNAVRDFQTGIYDYNTMVSTFVRSKDLTPVKVSFSSAEWCGHVYEELLFYPAKITGQYISYFEGESGPRNLSNDPKGILEDTLLIQLRSLRGEFLKAGEKKSFPFLPGVYYSRLAHKSLAWSTAEIERSAETQTIEVPAGKFVATVYTVKITDGRTGKFFVEQDWPHRIVRWSLLPDVSAEMTGSARLDYWRLHNNGDDSYLKSLGIKPTVE